MLVHSRVSAFISYSWDSEPHKQWVRDLATRLREDGIDVVLDQWHTAPGDQLPKFMENAIRENDYVLVICTPKYKSRSDQRKGGVGYEGDVMTAEVLTQGLHRKFVPLLRSGEWIDSAPTWILGKYYLDFRSHPEDKLAYEELRSTLMGRRVEPPQLGKPSSARHGSITLGRHGRRFDLTRDSDKSH